MRDAPDPQCIEHAGAVELVIEARSRDLGGFTVGRLLPSPRRRFVGPFVFLDHMGPPRCRPSSGMDVRPHPHIGLSTVTYLFSGENVHRDNLGSVQVVRPGDLNIMTAGRGIAHSERISPEQRARGGAFHGAQIWLGLPVEHEHAAPSFAHHDQAALPAVEPAAGARGRVLIGAAFAKTSPVAHPSKPLLVDLELEAGARLELPVGEGDRGVFVVAGECAIGDCALGRDQLAVVRGGAVVLETRAASRVLVLGGPPLGPRFIEWNFVSSSQADIDRASAAWRAQDLVTFPKIPGDDVEFTPLPERHR